MWMSTAQLSKRTPKPNCCIVICNDARGPRDARQDRMSVPHMEAKIAVLSVRVSIKNLFGARPFHLYPRLILHPLMLMMAKPLQMAAEALDASATPPGSS